MFASGLPARSSSNPVDGVLAALEMVNAVQRLGEVTQMGWRIRIGLNTGPVIAGVVGIRKFLFDIWGDTVNFAARMESAGCPNRVNLSSSTYARVRDFFDCEKQEKVRVYSSANSHGGHRLFGWLELLHRALRGNSHYNDPCGQGRCARIRARAQIHA